MGSYLSWLQRKDPRKPVKGVGPRIKNILAVHFRGILGTLVPLALLSWQPEKGQHNITVKCLWMLMFWTMLVQPIAVPASGFLPLFLLPMCGVSPTVEVAGHYFNDNICLYILGGMLHLLINTSGCDRRIILWLLCSGDSCQFSGKRLVFKASTAAFFLSMFSNRLIVTSTITQFLSTGLMNLQTSTSKNRKVEPDYDEMRYIILNAVQSASSIGTYIGGLIAVGDFFQITLGLERLLRSLCSIAILHAALTPITMKAIWSTNITPDKEYADVFNYLQYTCFAFPLAFSMFIFTFIYHMLLVNWVIGKPMSGSSMIEMRNFLIKQRDALPPCSNFEKETVFFYLLFLAACMFRWSEWLNMGWSSFRAVGSDVPLIKDATVAAAFLILLSILPRTLTAWKYINAKKKSELGTLKPDSAILWWRFADKNTNYGYVILIGGAIALNVAIRTSGLSETVTKDYGLFITKHTWNTSIFYVCLISIILANIMSGIAACCIFLPFVLNMALEGVAEVWIKRVYLGTLGVGIGTSMGFTTPFLYTPAYFCHFTGKVPIKKMVKYGIGTAIICLIILWLFLLFYAPIILDPNGEGIKSFALTTNTTEL